MKKIISTVLISLIALPAFSADRVEEIFESATNVSQTFFQSSIVPFDPEVKEQSSEKPLSNSEYFESTDQFTDHMPLFKKARLRLLKAVKTHNVRVEDRDAKKEAERIRAEEEKEKARIENLDIKYLEYSGTSEKEVADKKKDIPDEEKSENTIELTGGVKEHVTEKEMQLDCDTVTVVEETGDVTAEGNPVLTIPAQNTILTADVIHYNRLSNILKAIGNVVLTKDGAPMYGDYLQVNMNEENVLMENVKALPNGVTIVAKNAVSDNGILTLHEGKVFSEVSNTISIESTMVGPNFKNMLVNDEDKGFLFPKGDGENDAPSIKLISSQIYVNADPEHDVYKIKDTEFYLKDKYLFTWPSFTAYTNKKREYFEANYPEFGSQLQLGTYFGPGLVLPGPHGSTFKIIPMVNIRNKLGFGGAVKFKSAFNDTQIMYGSASDIWVARGKQILDENLYLQYGTNAYMDDWFMGSRLSKYMAELVYQKAFPMENFLYEGADLTYTHRGSVGYIQDGEWNMHSENIKNSGVGTMRLKYMAEVNQILFKRENREERKAIKFGIRMQGSAAVYGTGDTQFLGKIGPNLHVQYKNWMQDLGYFQAAVSDNTPLPVSDMYRYGHSSFYITEAFRLCKYLSVGWSGYVNLSHDSPNGELFQENAFVFSIGPDDFKFNLGYDIMRKTTYFSMGIMLDTKNTTLEYDKMEIKNPENLGQSNKKPDDAAFRNTTASNAGKKVLQYAEVIDIEDPDKESI